MSTAVSPARPDSMSPTCRRSRACGSRPPRPASATRTAPTCCSPCSTRARRSPASSPARNARPRRSNGAAPSSKGGKARALVVNSGNANAFTGKTGRAATAAAPPRSPPRRVGCKADEVFLASTGVIGEPLDATQVRRRDGRRWSADARADGWPRRRQGDHDHRHLPEGRDRDRETRQGHRHHQRHRQGRRHDRARHGDDAVLRLHRRADRGARAADAAARRRRRHLQRRHHRRRHLDLRHAARFRDRRGRERGAPKISTRRATRA